MRQIRNQKPEIRNQKLWPSEAFPGNEKAETRNQKPWLSGAVLVSGFWFLLSREVRNA
jgi:hypothetical protein